MQDKRDGTVNRVPFKRDERVVVLSPIMDSYEGKQYNHNNVLAGEVPDDPLDYFCYGQGEIPDREFRKKRPGNRHQKKLGFAEKRHSKY